MSDPFQLALFGVGGVVLGYLVNALVTYLLNEQSKQRDRRELEQSRKLELYKVVYPEIVKAAVTLMSKAGAIRKDIRVHYIGRQDLEEAARLQDELGDILTHAEAYEALLGPDIVKATNKFRMTCIETYLVPKVYQEQKPFTNDFEWAYEPSYQELNRLLRSAIQMELFDGLFMLKSAHHD